MSEKLNYAIILEYNKGVLPGGIRFFMNIWRRIKRLPKRVKIHNHVEILYYLDGELMVVGAVKGGFRPRIFKDEMPRNHWKNLMFMVSKEPFTDVQKILVEQQIRMYVFGHQHRNYEYLNFISWPVYILTFGKVRLSKKTDKRMECYEAAARVYNAAGNYFPNPEYTDIFQYYENPMLVEYVGWEEEIEKILTKKETQ